MTGLEQSEADFQAQIIELAETVGWKVWHDNDSRRNRSGFPDLELLRGATMLRLEVKTDTGVVTPAQEAYIQRLKQIKFVYADVVRPRDWADLEDVIRRVMR